MTKLLVIKEYLKHFYSKYDIYIMPLLKFLLALTALSVINLKLGYMEKLDNILIVLVVALMCSFLPLGSTVGFGAAFVLLHLYSLSLECAAVVLALVMVMFLLYFRFTPKDALILLLTPVCFIIKIPYLVPIAMGLLGTPVSIVSVGCGTIIYYVLAFINGNATAINAIEDDVMTRFRYIIDGIVNNKAMIVTLAAFSVTVILVYLIRKLSIDYSWTIGMIAGGLVNIAILLIGDLMYDTNVSILGMLLGTLASLLLAKALQFFVFSVDYSRTERVQFEDDEYYYYVKAVPKLNVATPEKTVKKINTQKVQGTQTKTDIRSVNTVNSLSRNSASDYSDDPPAGRYNQTASGHTQAGRPAGSGISQRPPAARSVPQRTAPGARTQPGQRPTSQAGRPPRNN